MTSPSDLLIEAKVCVAWPTNILHDGGSYQIWPATTPTSLTVEGRRLAEAQEQGEERE